MDRKGPVIRIRHLIYVLMVTAMLASFIPMQAYAAKSASADLDQWANDNAAWVNGNLGSSKATYYEGNSIPYRLKFGSLDTSIQHTVTIEWDTTKSGKNALDYLTTYDASTPTNPLDGISLNSSTISTFEIPYDDQVTATVPTPISGNFTLYGGTITGVSDYSGGETTFPSGDNSRQISITFTAEVANPVLAWGGHISTRIDWGQDSSCVSISGSPYHTRLIDLDGSGGNQDRSLSNDAVTFPGTITIIKDATPNGSTSFGFATTGGLTPSTFSLVDDGTSANTQEFSVTTFTTYTVTESSIPADWGFDSVSCNFTTPWDSSHDGSVSTSGTTATIDIKEGEDYICTYENSIRVGTLTVIKHVVNDDGGTSDASNWSIHVKSGGTEVTGSPQNGAESPGTSYTLPSGTYVISEDAGPSGYSGPTFSGDCDSSGNVTVVDGKSKTCTLTNDDIAPTLKLVKTVTKDYGGDAVADDWTLSATAASPDDGRNFSNLGGSGVFKTVYANVGYDLSESSSVTGYNAGSWICEGGGSLVGSTITLGLDDDVTCTITNDDIAPTLTLVKEITNNNGGTAKASDWTLTATGPVNISGKTGTAAVTSAVVSAGTYTLSELTGPAGYTSSSWSCTGTGTQDGDNITLEVGQSAVCTITNDDQAGSLTIVKRVVNDEGGTATVDDFSITTDAGTLNFGAGVADGTDTLKYTSDALTVDAGKYTFSESDIEGYTEGSWSCTGADATGTAYDDGSVTVPNGVDVVCTITNNDQAGSLTIVKRVVNDEGGTATVDDFSITTDAGTLNFGAGVADGTDTLKYTSDALTVDAGSYTFSESDVDGYSEGTWSCTGAEATGTDYNAGSVTVPNGVDVVCTITNDDQQGSLQLVKVVTNDNGGEAKVADFGITTNAGTLSWDTVTEDGNNTAYTSNAIAVDAGSYTFSESDVDGYSEGSWSCTGADATGTAYNDGSVIVPNGADVVCTITNDDDPPTLGVTKTGTITYTIVVTNDSPWAATNVLVDDDLPGGLDWAEGGVTTDPIGTGTWEITTIGETTQSHLHGKIDSLASGASVTVTVTATIDGHDDLSPLPNSVSVDWDYAGEPVTADADVTAITTP